MKSFSATRRPSVVLSALLTAATALIVMPKGQAQESNSRRVIMQSQNGLGRPSGTYIGPGTTSATARGQYGTGVQNNPNLPRVNMGSTVATPGDNMYGANPTQVRQAAPNQPAYYNNQAPGVVNPNLPATKLGANVGIAGDNIRSDMNGVNQVRKAPATYFNHQAQQPMYYQQQQPQQAPQIQGVGSYGDAAPVKQEIHF
jgi:hypothetical protein